MRSFYHRIKKLASGPHALRGLALVSFIESSFFPVPPDVMLVPMVLADRRRAWYIATVCTLASVMGGVFGYMLGLFAFEAIGQPLLSFYGKLDSLDHFQAWYQKYGSMIVFAAGLTPFPYKVITIASGALKLNFGVFILASVLARGMRFFFEAGLLWYFGPRLEPFLERYFALITLGIFLCVFAGFFALKLFFS